ncbi:hypothetical protein FGIG_08193 [Fasciola gigantica]|uniref:Uncharacterized protein n=1 Tax=Fasciola gigantica TaxID=46835 RepID=A0A504Z088_FASGI|nr:hypothetical protein FGIG_08193 [Fasciola gigantica]
MSGPWNIAAVLQLFHGNYSSVLNQATRECKESQIHMRAFYAPLIGISVVYTIIVSLQTRRRACCRPNRKRANKSKTSSVPLDKSADKTELRTTSTGCCQKYAYFSRHPGLPIPFNSIFFRHSTMAYACGYLCAFNIIAGIFSEYYSMRKYLPFAPIWFGMLFQIMSIAFLSTTLLPVFISITRGGFFCWTCGALYSVLQSSILLSSFARSICLGYRTALRQAGLQLPTLLGFLYLTFYFCQQLVLHRRSIRTDWLHYRLNKPSNYVYNTARYIQSRLRSPTGHSFNPAANAKLKTVVARAKAATATTTTTVTTKTNNTHCCLGLRNACSRLFYPPMGFTYPPILVWSLTVSLLLQYFLINQSLTWFYDVIAQGRYSISQRFPDLNKTLGENLAISNARHVYSLFEIPKNSSEETILRLQFAFIYYWIDIFWLCVLTSSFLALFSNTVSVFQILLNYQELSFAIYRGGHKVVPAMKRLLNPFKVTRGVILYPSYQIALMACGFYLQILIYGAIFILLSVVVTMNAFTNKAFIVYFFRTSWPSVVLITIFRTVQELAIRFLFTKHRGKSYGFNNVRSLQVYAFFASFYNVIFGLISGVGRILYCPISSAICISRMDISPLGIPLQIVDTGYVAFLGFLYADTTTNNPIMKTFLWILLHDHLVDWSDDSSFDSALLIEVECFDEWLHRSRFVRMRSNMRDEEQGYSQNINFLELARPHTSVMMGNGNEDLSSSNLPSASTRSTLARNRWFLAYTLIHNPDLRKWRRITPEDTAMVINACPLSTI